MADAWGRSWGGTFIVWGASEGGAAPIPVYGAPFLTFEAKMFENLTGMANVSQFVTLASEVVDKITGQAQMIEFLSFVSRIDEDS